MQPPSCLDSPVIFLDNDGTLTNADEHGLAYGRRYGELMAPRFGGTVEAWAEANAIGFEAMMAWYHANEKHYEDASFFDPLYRVGFEAAFRHLGLEPPPWEDEGRVVNRRLLFECPAAGCTLFPGAREAVEALAARGHRLCLASNAHSLHCEGVLIGCGLRPHFMAAFGPDLVESATKSVEFYRRIFRYVGCTPERAIVVDDNGVPLAMAREAGARTIFVDQGHGREAATSEPDAHIHAIADLPAAVARLTRR